MLPLAVKALSLLSLEHVVLLVTTLLLWWLPGLALSVVCGLRGWLLVTTAPAVTLGMTALAGTALGALNLAWTGTSAAVVGTVFVALAAALRHRHLATPTLALHRWSRGASLLVGGGIAVGAGLGFVVTMLATRGMTALPQQHDAPFQANAIRFFATIEDPHPQTLAWLVHADPGTYYYPTTYHLLESLVYRFTGASIPAVLDASLIVLVTAVLPLATVAVVRAASGSARLAATAALVSTAFQVFPYDMLGASQLIPYCAGLAALGSFLGLYIAVIRHGTIPAAAATAVAAVGILSVHNSAAFVAAIFAVAFLLHACHTVPVRTALVRTVGIAAGAFLLGEQAIRGALAATGSVVGTSVLPETETPAQALGEALFLGHNAWWPQMTLALLSLIGGLLLLRLFIWRWLVIAHGLLVTLVMITQTLPYPWAKLITAPWWNDRERVHAALGLGLALTAGYGLQATIHVLTTGLHNATRSLPPLRHINTTRPARRACAGAASLLVLVAYFEITDGYLPRNIDRLRVGFDDRVLSEQQRTALSSLRQVVPREATVLNDPNDGSVWMYALSGRHPLFGHYDSTASPEGQLLLNQLSQLDTNPQVQHALAHTGISYVLTRQHTADERVSAPGLQHLDTVAGLTPVWQQAGFALYHVTPGHTADRGSEPRSSTLVGTVRGTVAPAPEVHR